MITLRPQQIRAVQATHQAIRDRFTEILFVAPTGMGKRICAVWWCDKAQQQGKRVLFVTNRRLLVEQMFKEVDAQGISYGVIMSGTHSVDPSATVQIASLQTLQSRYFDTPELLPAADLILFDEAHQDIDRYQQLMQFYPGALIVGMTATPVGPQGKSMMPPYGIMVEEVKNTELIKAGYLLKTRVYAPSEPSIEGVKIGSSGEFPQDKLGKKVQECTVFADVFNEWAPFADRKTICFCPGIPYARDLERQFTARLGANRAFLICNDTPDKEKERIFKEMKDGEGRVVISVDMLREGFDCLDDQTEILASDGWRSIDNPPREGDLIWTLNRNTGEAEFSPVIRSVVRPVAPGEKMVRLDSQHLDIRVTEGHELHIQRASYNRPTGEWITLNARDLTQWKVDYYLPLSAPGLFEGVPLTDDELRFVAWFLTDGGFGGKSHPSSVEINQSKEFHNEIRDLLRRLGMTFQEYTFMPKSGFATTKVAHRFCIPMGKRGTCGWGRLAPYLDKDVSPLLDRMTRAQFSVFWEELMKGDGSRQRPNNSGQLTCNRKTQADRYMSLALVRGFASSYLKSPTKYGTYVYYVRVRDTKLIGSRPTDPRSTPITTEDPLESERVWCVTTRNGTIFTRRNGKAVILGNCPELSCAIDLQPNSQLRTYWQKVGRIKRTFGTQTEAIYLDFAGNYWRFPHPNSDPDWNVKGDETTQDRIEKRRKEGKESQPIMCPKCSAVRQSGDTCPACGYKAGKPVRRVRMGDGKLKEIPAIAKRKREKSAEELAMNKWKSAVFGGHKSDRSLAAAALLYHKSTGEWPKTGWPGVYDSGSLLAKRGIRSVFPEFKDIAIAFNRASRKLETAE